VPKHLHNRRCRVIVFLLKPSVGNFIVIWRFLLGRLSCFILRVLTTSAGVQSRRFVHHSTLDCKLNEMHVFFIADGLKLRLQN
jgi:hypothetical protein